jgi:pimeloyl-ACP methyl ester carboxylesterase
VKGDAMPTLHPGEGLTERLVPLPDGRRLRTIVAGAGVAEEEGPLVVFEAGMSGPAATWIHTQREVSRSARTLSYDRAGYGGSDVDRHPRTLERIVEDLTALLDAIGETAPVVLVGHSWGGPIIRLFADLHPERVAGLVFVDATIAEVMPAISARAAALSFKVFALLARLGGNKLITKMSMPHGHSAEISDEDMAVMQRDYACLSAMRAGGQEAKQILATLPTLRRLQDEGTPPVPTVCLQAGRVDRGFAKLRPRFNDTVAQLMAAAPDGRVVVVEQAGHLIPQECPGPVRDAILEVVGAARAEAR